MSVLSLAHGDNLQLFTKLGTTDKEACRKTDGSNSEIGQAFWEATGISTAEQCATLCLELLDDCQGFEHGNMAGTGGRCEIWLEDVTVQSVPTHPNPFSCYNRTTPQGGTAVPQYVALTLNFTGLNSSINTTVETAMTQVLKTAFSTNLSALAHSPEVNISESEVAVILMSCETLAIIISKPAGTNMIPIYEALGTSSSYDSKINDLRIAMNTHLAPYGLEFPDEHHPRAIGHIDGRPSSSTTCRAESSGDPVDNSTDDSTNGPEINGAHSKHLGVLTVLMLKVLSGCY